MPGIDIFNTDAFSTSSLTATINTVPEGQMVPTQLDALFSDVEGITTTSCWVELQGDTLALVENKPRSASGDPVALDRRIGRSFDAAHLPTRGAVMADEVQNIRAFGSETELQMIERKVEAKLSKMRRSLIATNSWHRMGALKGIIYDSDGSTVIYNLFTEFGVSQQSQSMELDQTTTKIRTLTATAQDLAMNVIGDSGMIRGWIALCGRTFFNTFIDHGDVQDVLRYQMASTLRAGAGSLADGFEYAGVIWQKLYGQVGDQTFITATNAYLIPIVDGLFITRYAPAPYVETVNTLGLPFYAKQEMMPFGRGVELEAVSCPVNLCTKPRAIIKLTLT